MKCPKCSYIFSEEKKICPRCGTDIGMMYEKLGFFPPSTSKPFFTIKDFMEKHENFMEKHELNLSNEKKREEIGLKLE